MRRSILLLFAASTILAACSSEPDGSGTPIVVDAGNNTESDAGTPDPDEDMATTPDPDGGPAGSDMGGAEDMAPTPNNDTPDMAPPAEDMAPDMDPGVYMAAGDPYAPGTLSVVTSDVTAGNGSPVDFIVLAPDQAGTYPLVVFQHGFVLQNSYYTTMLEHVASHGFVVVVPQMYDSGVFGAPSTEEEAATAREFYDWLPGSIGDLVDAGVVVDTSLMGLAGHSRGAKVLYTVIENGFNGAVAAAGVDPVDGGGGFGTATRVTDGGLDTTTPNLIIGAELGSELVFGMACAPEGDNHQAFYDAAPSPTWWTLGEGYGHLDMLNDSLPDCGLTCSACVEGPDDGLFRQFTAGQLAAFFRQELQGDTTMQDYLTGIEPAPITAQYMNK